MSNNWNIKLSINTKYKRLKKAHNVKNQHYYKNNNY